MTDSVIFGDNYVGYLYTKSVDGKKTPDLSE
jgi:hypothetical protein